MKLLLIWFQVHIHIKVSFWVQLSSHGLDCSSVTHPSSTPSYSSVTHPSSTPSYGSVTHPSSTPSCGSVIHPSSTPSYGSVTHPASTPSYGSVTNPSSTPSYGSVTDPSSTPFYYAFLYMHAHGCYFHHCGVGGGGVQHPSILFPGTSTKPESASLFGNRPTQW